MPGLMELLSYAGNAIDLPASSLRDLFAGSNPFDQWATPFSSDNRTSGRDMLNPIFGQNKETGMSGWLDDPMEGVADVLGFGAEMLLDPLNFFSVAGVMKALKGRKAAKSANKVIAAENASNAGKYGYVNAKLAGQTDELVNPITQQAPQKLLGYTSSSGSIQDRLSAAARMRGEVDEFFNSNIAGQAEGTPWESLEPLYKKYDELQNDLQVVDPTYGDRVAKYHSKPIVGVSRDEWLSEVGEKNQALKKLLRGLDMSQPDDQMVLKNLSSAFDGSADPFAESGPLMNTMRQFTSDIADADIAIIEPIYEAVYNPKFLDLAKRTAESAGVKVDDRFDQWLPELFHEGPTSRQARMFKGMRDGIPGILDETPLDDPTRAMMEQVLNVANIYKNPMDAAKFEYDRQLAKFAPKPPGNPMLPIQQVSRQLPRATESIMSPTMNPMRPLQQLPGLAAPAATSALYNVLARQNNYGGVM